jgi:hypothetical protein
MTCWIVVIMYPHHLWHIFQVLVLQHSSGYGCSKQFALAAVQDFLREIVMEVIW